MRKLNGQWAFAIWDTASGRCFLSRDRLGVRPLVLHTECGDRLAFASEIKALFAHPRSRAKIDPLGIDNVFTFWTTLRAANDRSKAIYELPPGHSLTWRDGRTTVARHWRPTFAPASATTRPTARIASSAARSCSTSAIRICDCGPTCRSARIVSGGLDSVGDRRACTRASNLTRPCARSRSPSAMPEFDEQQPPAAGRRARSAPITARCAARTTTSARVMPDVVWHAETPLAANVAGADVACSRQCGRAGRLQGRPHRRRRRTKCFGGYDIFKGSEASPLLRRSVRDSRAACVAGASGSTRTCRRCSGQPAGRCSAFFDHARGDTRRSRSSRTLPRWRVTSRLKMLLSGGDACRRLAAYDGARSRFAAQLPPEFGGVGHPFCAEPVLEMSQLLPGYILSSQGDRVAMAHGVEAGSVLSIQRSSSSRLDAAADAEDEGAAARNIC